MALIFSSLSDSVWIDKSNSTCGISVKERDNSLSGTWTVMAELSGQANRVLRSSVQIGSQMIDETKIVEEEKKLLGFDVDELEPYIIGFFCVGGLVMALPLVLVCLVCHYRKKARDKKKYECPQVTILCVMYCTM
jgi:hypothetical protein